MSLWNFLSSKRTSESESRENNDEESNGTNDEESKDTDESSGEYMEPDQESPSQEISEARENACTDRCSQHEKELIQYDCQLHDCLGCGVCIMIDHRNCEGVVYIPKVADELPNSTEFKDFEKDLADLREKSEKIIDGSRENIPKAANDYQEALRKMEEFRKEKLGRLVQMENELKAKAAACKDENTERMNTLLNKTAATKNQVCTMLSDMETLIKEKQLCKLYIEMKIAKRQISEIHETLDKLERENFVTTYKLVPGKRKLDLIDGLDEEVPTTSNDEVIQERKKLKAVRKTTGPIEVKADHVTDVCIKSETDESIVCKAEGLAVMPGNRLVVVDRNNCKVKLVDTLQNKIIAELTVPSAPLGVTGINEKQVAVAMKADLAPKCDKILILKVDRTLKAERLVKSNLLFEGDIAFHKDKFLVIRDNGCQVHVIDLIGKDQRVDLEGQAFGCFVAVAVAPAKDVYIASVEHQDNCEEGYVLRKTRLDREMNCVQAVQNVVYGDLFQMHHAADQTGRVFVITPRTIQVMDEEGSEPRILLSHDNGVYSPISLAFDQETNKLYVGMSDNNYLKVFRLG